MDKDDFYGIVEIADSEKDWQLVAGVNDAPVPRNTFWDAQIQYHQPDVSSVSCTIHGAFGCVSDLLKFVFTDDQRKALWALALARGAKEGFGWSLRGAVDLVRDEAEKYTGVKLSTYQVKLLSAEFGDLISKGYSVNVGYSGNKEYNSDKLDGRLDKTSFGVSTYGHSVRMCEDKEDVDFLNVVVDNYSKSTSKPNIYRIAKEALPDLVNNGVFFQLGYVFIVKEDETRQELLDKIPAWGLSAATKAMKKGIDIANMDLEVGGALLEDTLIKLGGLTQRLGSVSLLRYLVAADRLNNLN